MTLTWILQELMSYYHIMFIHLIGHSFLLQFLQFFHYLVEQPGCSSSPQFNQLVNKENFPLILYNHTVYAYQTGFSN